MSDQHDTEVRRPVAPPPRSSANTMITIGIALIAAIAIIAVFFVIGADRAPTDGPDLGNPAPQSTPVE